MSVVALGINGRTWFELEGLEEFPIYLRRLNATSLFSLVMWRLPEGKRFEGSNPSKNSNEYLQCAGSCGRMTVEIRRREKSKLIQYTVGGAGETAWPELSERIDWADHHVYVAGNEVLDSESAFKLFEEYFASGELPGNVTLRKFNEVNL